MKKISNYISLFLLSIVFGYTGFYFGGRERYVDIAITKELEIVNKNEETFQPATPTPKVITTTPPQPKPTVKKNTMPKLVPKLQPAPEPAPVTTPIEAPPSPTTQVS